MLKTLRTLLPVLFLAAGLAAPAAAQDAPTTIPGATTVDANALIELVEQEPGLVILDNRKEADYAAGHIEGAVRLIDTDITDDGVLAAHIPAKDAPVLFYCNGVKCGRAANAVEKAVKAGYSKVYYYALGMDEWRQKNLPLVTN
ncbi:rhodanese-like domain-containing protein [Arenibaculum sp.]|jgi:rhodanese-related sulfurtransferase|uniref:rhodanese-like domain-containing protein n=1 Tax=Arenibaculum sp. TaxID=2865862 RepID=UPI002E13444D|nr:rhodanese-like domain-containing protein [Arenibaculum sp.]